MPTGTSGRKEKPILFKGDMVRAILNCKPGVWPAEPIDPSKPFKWQTRRVVKPQPHGETQAMRDIPRENRWWAAYKHSLQSATEYRPLGTDYQHDWKCPYGQAGDSLWVRETWKPYLRVGDIDQNGDQGIYYAADSAYRSDCRAGPLFDYQKATKLRPSIHMPRWASRINLEVKAVRVERVQEISNGDAIAEGSYIAEGDDWYDEQHYFADLWDRISEKRGYSWGSNPWVWVVEFMRMPG